MILISKFLTNILILLKDSVHFRIENELHRCLKAKGANASEFYRKFFI